ncbi:hypothetical protein VC83_04063 [Pseudogymnoascus destructans]|uniref:Uncharacterized protein n=1 Tax=Pseudogymnoascus destructans TaxID=655981 RepID=A0A177AF06_9PEZI|nr:uncharacterized protein VC83_04063 [Pseudogymnoascus destructans]OAF59763.1 hypothetical protein VC83_04063 [Pseudogymnoascus destructans]
MHCFNAPKKIQPDTTLFQPHGYPERWQQRHVLLGNTSHTNIIKSFKNLDPDRPPIITRGLATALELAARPIGHLFQLNAFYARPTQLLSHRVPFLFIPLPSSFKKFQFGNESLSMKPSSLLANVVDLVSDGDQKR